MIQIIFNKFAFIFIFVYSLNCQTPINNTITQYKNLIVNGNFTDNLCFLDYCVWTSQRYNSQVSGWQPVSRIQVGNTTIYSKQTISSLYVIMLRDNQCIRQIISRILPGSLKLKIKWAAKRYMNTSTYKAFLSVYQNNYFKFNFTTSNQLQKTQYLVLSDQTNCQPLQIKICGNNSIISYVQLIGNKIVDEVVNVPNQSLSGFYNPSTIFDLFSSLCVQKMFILDQDFYEINFSYRALGVKQTFLSYLTFYWNGKAFNIRKPIDQIKYFLNFQVNATLGINNLTFCPSICTQQNFYHQISFDNQLVTKKLSCLVQKYRNLIINSGFQTNSRSIATTGMAFYTNSTQSQLNLSNWSVISELQIGNAQVYKKALPGTFMIDLVQSSDTCIQQQLTSLKPGNYVLQLDWYARQSFQMKYNNFNVSIGSLLIKQITPQVLYVLSHQVIRFKLNSQLQNPLMFICASGGSKTSQGSLIDNIKLFFQDGCLN